MSSNPDKSGSDPPIKLPIGKEELVISRRYETASIANDVLLGLCFLTGSILFLLPEWKEVGTWVFIFGSFQLVMRPAIRLAHRVHLKRRPGQGMNW
jgi:hypothetical protein